MPRFRKLLRAILIAALLVVLVLPASGCLFRSATATPTPTPAPPNGYEILLEADGLDRVPTADEIGVAVDLLERSLKAQDIDGATVTSDKASGHIKIRLKTDASESETLAFAGTLVAGLGDPSRLAFLDPDGAVILDGGDVKECKVLTMNGQDVVDILFTAEGTTIFADATERLLGRIITIRFDGKVLASPTVNAVIADGEAILQQIASKAEAEDIAAGINASALPFRLVARTATAVHVP